MNYDAETFASAVVSLKRGNVAADNAAKSFSIETFKGFFTGDLNQSIVTATLIRAYGNPKTPAGKESDKLSCLRYAVGGEGARKAAERTFYCWDNREVEGVSELLRLYVLSDITAPKSLNKLVDSVKALVKAAAPETDADGESEGESEGETTEATATLSPDERAIIALDFLTAYVATTENIPSEVQEKFFALRTTIASVSAPKPVKKAA